MASEAQALLKQKEEREKQRRKLKLQGIGLQPEAVTQETIASPQTRISLADRDTQPLQPMPQEPFVPSLARERMAQQAGRTQPPPAGPGIRLGVGDPFDRTDQHLAHIQDINRRGDRTLADMQGTIGDLNNIGTQFDPRIAQGVNSGFSALAQGVGSVSRGVGNAFSNFARGFSQPARLNEQRISESQQRILASQMNMRAQQVQMGLQRAQTALKLFDVQDAQLTQRAKQNYPAWEKKVKETFLPIMKNVLIEQNKERAIEGLEPMKHGDQETFQRALKRHEEAFADIPELQFSQLDKETAIRSPRARALFLQHNILPSKELAAVVQKEAEGRNATKEAIAKQAAGLPAPGVNNNFGQGGAAGQGAPGGQGAPAGGPINQGQPSQAIPSTLTPGQPPSNVSRQPSTPGTAGAPQQAGAANVIPPPNLSAFDLTTLPGRIAAGNALNAYAKELGKEQAKLHTPEPTITGAEANIEFNRIHGTEGLAPFNPDKPYTAKEFKDVNEEAGVQARSDLKRKQAAKHADRTFERGGLGKGNDIFEATQPVVQQELTAMKKKDTATAKDVVRAIERVQQRKLDVAMAGVEGKTEQRRMNGAAKLLASLSLLESLGEGLFGDSMAGRFGKGVSAAVQSTIRTDDRFVAFDRLRTSLQTVFARGVGDEVGNLSKTEQDNALNMISDPRFATFWGIPTQLPDSKDQFKFVLNSIKDLVRLRFGPKNLGKLQKIETEFHDLQRNLLPQGVRSSLLEQARKNAGIE